MSLYALDLRDRQVRVVGGGPAAAVRVRQLLADGAVVVVHAPAICEDLVDLVADGEILWRAGDLSRDEVRGAWLVSVQDADAARDRDLTQLCAEEKVWLEHPAGGDLRPVATTKVDGVEIGVAGAGAEPILARLATAVHEGVIPVPAAPGGRVVLVGGGPGATDLLTLRGRRELARADVVVTDRLAPIGVLAELGRDVEVVHVGKSPYHHPVPQPEINRILIERAQAGQHVVRLKGGDPFVLGRGGEEMAACREAGVDVEVVPGVSSALAAPAAADIPVTHRGVATGFLVVSGHDALETDSLAQWAGTVIVLMGMARLEELCAALRRAGRPDRTPAAVIHQAWTQDERVVRGTLQSLPGAVRAAQVGNPAVIVIGDVAAVLADRGD